ncbi:MAG: hypothetical protein JSU07_01645 [Bacteroidetes bacterium]|nr:hypothetical protein [Bacteroidota bacterium]
MGYIYLGIPKELLKLFAEKTGYQNFVETGTFSGRTIIWAASLFNNCYTIEINKEFSENAANTKNCPKNIQFIVGDSRVELKKIVSTISDGTIFWLDGHYSGEETGGKENECPIIDEIEIIKKHQNSIILIDDARFFLGPPPEGHRADDWPGIDEIFYKLKINFPNHYTTLIDDTIISCPKEYKYILDSDWKKNFKNRYPSPTEKPSYLSKLKRIIKK